jgi:hypothetical protein
MAAGLALHFITRRWRGLRNLCHCRLEFLAAAALRAPLKLPEILEGAGKLLKLAPRERIDRFMVV